MWAHRTCKLIDLVNERKSYWFSCRELRSSHFHVLTYNCFKTAQWQLMSLQRSSIRAMLCGFNRLHYSRWLKAKSKKNHQVQPGYSQSEHLTVIIGRMEIKDTHLNPRPFTVYQSDFSKWIQAWIMRQTSSNLIRDTAWQIITYESYESFCSVSHFIAGQEPLNDISCN